MFGLLLALTLVFQAVYAKDLSVSDSVLINDDFPPILWVITG